LLKMFPDKKWAAMQENVYKTKIPDVHVAKTLAAQRVVEDWEQLSESVIQSAVRHWCCRLPECVKARGRRFEHKL